MIKAPTPATVGSQATNKRVPDLLLEQLHLGELSPDEAAAVTARLALEPGGAERLTALESSDEAVFSAFPPELFAATVQAEAARRDHLAKAQAADHGRQRSAPRAALPWSWLAGPVVALTALALWVQQPAERGPRPNAPEAGGAWLEPALRPASASSERAKGTIHEPVSTDAVRLLLWAKRGGQTVALDRGALAKAGDQVQLGYFARRRSFLVILSLDGRGQITLHAPEEGPAAELAEVGTTHTLPYAYELDDAPDFERFVLVSGDEDFSIATIKRAAQQVLRGPRPREMALALPAGLSQTSLVILKTAPKAEGRRP